MGLLLRTDLLAKDRSAVTRVIEILRTKSQMTVTNHFDQIERRPDFPRVQGLCYYLYVLLTFPQICVSGSQKELSASYPSPRWEEKGKQTQTFKKHMFKY